MLFPRIVTSKDGGPFLMTAVIVCPKAYLHIFLTCIQLDHLRKTLYLVNLKLSESAPLYYFSHDFK